MPGHDTAELKSFLKTRMRRRVGHPVVVGETVRVEGVTREGWTFRYRGAGHNMLFEDMGEVEIENVSKGGGE
jgi:hypothetical protein